MRAEAADHAGGTRYRENAAALLPHHRAAGVLDAVKHAIEQHSECGVPGSGVGLQNRPEGAPQSRVVHHEVEPTMQMQCMLDSLSNLSFKAHVRASQRSV